LFAKSNQLKKISIQETFSNSSIDSSISFKVFPLFFLDPSAFEFPRLGRAAEFPEDISFLFWYYILQKQQSPEVLFPPMDVQIEHSYTNFQRIRAKTVEIGLPV
jgi:hypothetical protein